MGGIKYKDYLSPLFPAPIQATALSTKKQHCRITRHYPGSSLCDSALPQPHPHSHRLISHVDIACYRLEALPLVINDCHKHLRRSPAQSSMFHVKHLMVDRHSSAPPSPGFRPPATPHPHILTITSHIQRPLFHVKHRSLLKLTPQPHPSRLALLRVDLGAPRLRHAPSPVANVSRETSHHCPHTAAQLRFHHPVSPLTPHPSHTTPSHFPMFHVKHQAPQECKRAAASPRKVTPPPMPGDVYADTADKHRPYRHRPRKQRTSRVSVS